MARRFYQPRGCKSQSLTARRALLGRRMVKIIGTAVAYNLGSFIVAVRGYCYPLWRGVYPFYGCGYWTALQPLRVRSIRPSRGKPTKPPLGRRTAVFKSRTSGAGKARTCHRSLANGITVHATHHVRP